MTFLATVQTIRSHRKRESESVSVSVSECLERLHYHVFSSISTNKTIWLLSSKVTFQYYCSEFCDDIYWLSLRIDHWLNSKRKRTDSVDEDAARSKQNESSSNNLKGCCH